MENSSAELTGARSLSLGDLLIAIPVFHLICTISYLYSYAVGFGSNIDALYSGADIAGTAIRQMPLVYGAALVLALITLLIGRQSTEPFPDGPFAWKTVALAGAALIGLPALSIAIGAEEAWVDSKPFDFYSSGQIWFGVPIFLAALLSAKYEALYRQRVTVALTILIVSMASYFGTIAGHADRYAVFAQAIRERPSCNSVAILRGISDKLLVVLKDGHKAVYTADCKPFMALPEPAWLRENSSIRH